MPHDRNTCIDCGRTLNPHEWLYGACSACIKRRARANGWHPERSGGWQFYGWFWVDNAPRWAEYGDPQDMDTEGVVKLIETLGKLGGIFARAQSYDKMQSAVESLEPRRSEQHEGLKRCIGCGHLIPILGPTRCATCRDTHKWRKLQQRLAREANHECVDCGAKLPEGHERKRCDKCLEKGRNKAKEQRRNKQR